MLTVLDMLQVKLFENTIKLSDRVEARRFFNFSTNKIVMR